MARPLTTRCWRAWSGSSCLIAALVGGCATPDAHKFVERYRLQEKVGPLYELVAAERAVGWLYGAVHYGTIERPSMSPAAVHAMARTRHVYLENTDRVGTSWPMRYAVAEDPEAIAQAKKKAAQAAADRVWQGVLDAKRMERESDGVEIVFSQNAAYHEHWMRANNYCGAFYEYGTERLALLFATGRDVNIHALETVASRQTALDGCPRERAPSPSADAPIGATFETMCAATLRDIALDQSVGRPHATTNAALCVLDGRHRTMAETIARAVKAGETPFVIVGRGHLMSGQTLVERLGAHGIAVRRID